MVILKNLRSVYHNVLKLRNIGFGQNKQEVILCHRHIFLFKQCRSLAQNNAKLSFEFPFINKFTTNDKYCRTIQSSLLFRQFCVDSSYKTEEPKAKISLFKRLLGQRYEYDDEVLINSGRILYAACSDGVDFSNFMSKCKLPDTYYSWFRITELHIWLCMVRVMAEAPAGKIVRSGIIEALWTDANLRAKKIGVLNATSRSESMNELNSQFIAALFMYDEGLQSDDIVLASSLWYRLLQSKCDDPAIVARLVDYVRQQVVELEKCSREDIIRNGNISFSPL